MNRLGALVLLLAMVLACRGEPPAKAHATTLSGLVDSLRPKVEAVTGLRFKSPPRSALRTREQVRQFDRQREEIHPPHVLSALAALQEPPPEALGLKDPKPDPDREYPVQILPIRPYEKENDL